MLLGLAYRLLGRMWDAEDAEDAVQEAYLRWTRTGRDDVRDPRAFLVTVVSRLALDQLRSARVTREAYVGPWLPAPVDTRAAGPLDTAELRDTLSYATLHLMERLMPPERAVFGPAGPVRDGRAPAGRGQRPARAADLARRPRAAHAAGPWTTRRGPHTPGDRSGRPPPGVTAGRAPRERRPPHPPSLTGLTSYLLSRTGKAARGALAAELAREGLRLWHMAVLAALADFGPHAQRELSARLAIDPSDVVKVIDELAAPGWVEQARDPADRRRVVISLTGEGRAALAAIDLRARAVQDAVLRPLDAGERRQLHALLARVHAELPPRPGAPRRETSPS
jgi:DNA-binding MarR family transcriptional regulator